MINEKGGYVEVLKRKLDGARNQIKIMSRRYKDVKKQNRLLRDQLMMAKKEAIR